MIDILDKLHDSGELRKMVNFGLISTNVLTWMKIYKAYHFQIESGVKSRQAIVDVSDTFGVSDITVYNVLKKLNPKTNK